MVFDAHDRAFALFKGTCGRGVYDNMKTAVETIFVGKGHLYNRRFMQMCSHYLVDPVACAPASGWEKGQVENRGGLVRERFFTPRLRFKADVYTWLNSRAGAGSVPVIDLRTRRRARAAQGGNQHSSCWLSTMRVLQESLGMRLQRCHTAYSDEFGR
jgi:transposase